MTQWQKTQIQRDNGMMAEAQAFVKTSECIVYQCEQGKSAREL